MLLLPRWDGEVGDEEEEGLGQQRGGLVDLYEDGADDARQGRSVHGVGGNFFIKTEITDPGPGGAVELMEHIHGIKRSRWSHCGLPSFKASALLGLIFG